LAVGTPVVFATVTVAVMNCPDAQTVVIEVTCGSGRGAGKGSFRYRLAGKTLIPLATLLPPSTALQ
jgi:hypothetical protein